MPEGRVGRNGPRVAGGDGGYNNGGWKDEGNWHDNGNNSNGFGRNTHKNGSVDDDHGGYSGGRNGGYQKGGDRNGYDSYQNGDRNGGWPSLTAKPDGAQRTNPFGAAGPAGGAGAGPASTGFSGGAGGGAKYVPPALRNGVSSGADRAPERSSYNDNSNSYGGGRDYNDSSYSRDFRDNGGAYVGYTRDIGKSHSGKGGKSNDWDSYDSRFDGDYSNRKGSGKGDRGSWGDDRGWDKGSGKGKDSGKSRRDDYDDFGRGGKGKDSGKNRRDDYDDNFARGGKGKDSGKSRRDDYDDDFGRGGKGKDSRGRGDDSEDRFGKGGKGNDSRSKGKDSDDHFSRGGKGDKGKDNSRAKGRDDDDGMAKGGKGKDGKNGKSKHRDEDTGGKAGRGGKGDQHSDDEDNGKTKGAGGKGGKKGKEGKANGKSDDAQDRKGSKKGAPRKESYVYDYDEDEDHEDVEPQPNRGKTAKSAGSGAVTGSHLSDDKFSSLPISKETKKAMAEAFGYELMTKIQAAAIRPLVEGKDVLARAQTGTGKTIAFMIPVIEKVREYPTGVGGGISALVLSPTRELAQQIHDEAKILIDYHRKLGIQCIYGGTNMKSDLRSFSQKACDILVATPGRLQDHLDNTPNFANRLGELAFLVLDEADQLLETGFRDAILKILRFLPAPKQRQGALFSATFPAQVAEISKLALKPNNVTVNTVTDEVTPDQIAQSVAITDIEGMTETLWSAISSEMKREPKNYKIMVFFVAARVTQVYAEMFNTAGVPVHEIHSRKSQGHRTKAADTFRSQQHGIVFSSDVLARGLDFPGVTSVIQVGVPSGREQYIHRLGRTGRAGKAGGCILLLHEFEQYFLKNISDLPVKRLNGKQPFSGAAPAPDALWRPPVPKTGCQGYQAWLGYYNSAKGLGWKKDHLVQQAARFADSIMATQRDGQPPPLLRKTVGKMGLKGVPGLNLVAHLDYADD